MINIFCFKFVSDIFREPVNKNLDKQNRRKMNLNQQQILALAPDDASAKAGTQLSNPNNWVLKCAHALALWGECQGSGKTPYKTSIDLTNIAFKCSCPSRKFPCKHGIGLLLMFGAKPAAFNVVQNLPTEVEEWITKRATVGATLVVAQEKKTIDETAQQKRIEARQKKIIDGIEELQTWLKDVVRTGIMNVPQDPYKFASNIIARMNDAQATGLAYQLKKIAKINFYAEGWQKELTKILSKTYVLSEAYRRDVACNVSSELSNVSLDLQREDLNTLIGWTKNKEIVLQSDSVHDFWAVLSKTTEEEDNLTTESIWLRGERTERFAQILNFYGYGQRSENLISVGTTLDAELVYYPSAFPQRALIKTQQYKNQNVDEVHGVSSIEAIKNSFAEIISTSPFIERVPFILNYFRILFENKQWFLVDSDAKSLRILNSETECWLLLSITRGALFTSFSLYENAAIHIQSLWFNHIFHPIK